MKLTNVDQHLQEQLKDPYFRELHELEMQKLELIKPIIEYRVKHKLNQMQLAKRVGVSQQHISKIEAGEFSNILTLEKILLFLGYTVHFKAIPLKPSVIKKINGKRLAA